MVAGASAGGGGGLASGSAGSAAAGSLVIDHGPRAAEARLLEELGHLAAAGARDPRLLARPVRVVVPSRSLRQHLSARLVERLGGAVAGVSIQTLHALVLSILTRADAEQTAEESLFPVLIRQLARVEPALRAPLEPLLDGYGAVEAGVADLLDAGFEAAHLEAVIDRIADLGRGAMVERACAVARVAAAAERAGACGVEHRSALVRRARELLEADPDRLLPARAIFVFGFADATGVQTDLIEALFRCGARVIVDWPRDPADPEHLDCGVAHARRFSGRFSPTEPADPAELSHADSTQLAVLHAPGRESEVRTVVDRVRALLDSGARPEGIAVVARSLDGYRALLRTHLARLGVPFSGVGECGGAAPHGRRLAALLALLRAGDRTPLDRWLDLVATLPASPGGRPARLSPSERADLRLAFHARGAACLEDAARLELGGPPTGDWVLPVRGGLRARDAEVPLATRRAIPRARVAAAVAAARAASRHVAAWPSNAPLGQHLDALCTLVSRHLGWQSDDDALEALRASVLDAPAPRDFPLDRGDFGLYLERSLADSGTIPLGGAGAGVAVLSAMEARARTFEHLFVIGLSRDVFPRPISEDPLLPDTLRRSLRVLLPDLPVKRDGVDEERYLFAQLLSASPRVVLSCPLAGEDGQSRPISPLLERLDAILPVATSGLFRVPPAEASRSPLRPAHEHALLAGLHGTREQFRHALAVAVGEIVRTPNSPLDPDPAELARLRLAVLAEWEPRGRRPDDLGPYLGNIGANFDKADPRRGPLFVTTAEQIAGCPWQAFVRVLLRIERPPDAQAELPAADPRMVGSLVHEVLREIVADVLPEDAEDLAHAVRREPIAIPWPDADRLEAALMRAAKSQLRGAGIATAGFARVLAALARGHLDRARRQRWPEPGSGAGVLGVEVPGVAMVRDLAGAVREIRFSADRVDRLGESLRLIDYKTGRVFADQKRDDRRRESLRVAVARGSALQAAAYALAGARCGSAEGEYVFLDPEAPDHARSATVPADDAEFADAFETAAQAVLAVWDTGSFFPRLSEPPNDAEPRRCLHCEVKEACVRGDSGVRRRVERWIASSREAPGDLGAAERAMQRLWDLGRVPP